MSSTKSQDAGSDPGVCIPSRCGHRNADISEIFLWFGCQ